MIQPTATDAIDIVCHSREQWLATRRNSIGASESPTLFGEGYANQSPYTIWADKLGLTERDPDEEAKLEERFRCGQVLQPAILQLFSERTRLKVEDPGEFTVRLHPEHRWMSATLDGVCEHPTRGPCVVEAKNVSGFNAAEWRDGVSPLRVQVQVQHQLAVTGYAVGYIVGLIGGNELHVVEMPRDDTFIDVALIPTLDRFWRRVEDRTPPEIDDSKATAALLAKLFPDDNGEAVELPPEAAGWDERLQRVKEEIKGCEAVERHLSNKLREAIGANTIGVLPGGGQYSLTTTHRKEYTVAAKSFRTLRRRK
jgi:putative phage-type endonuclease